NCTDAIGNTGNKVPERWIGCPLVNGIGMPATITPANLSQWWESEKVRRYPKLGDNNSVTWAYYIRDNTGTTYGNGPIYRVTFAPIGGQTLGQASMNVSVSVDECMNGPCTSVVNKGTKTILFNMANEFLYWEPGEGVDETQISDNGPTGGGAFFGGVAREVITGGNASRLDWNDDNNDVYRDGNGNKIDGRIAGSGLPPDTPATPDPFGRIANNLFTVGDFIPLDWKDPHNLVIQQHMAPNTIGGAAVPDFGISTYYKDHRVGNEQFLELKDTRMRPLAPDGGTPTGGAMGDFYSFLSGNDPASGNPGGNWKTSGGFIAAAANAATGDPDFACKKVYMLLITDGLASDGTASCAAADALRTLKLPSGSNFPVRTYVIGLGLTNTTNLGHTNTLQCVTDNGGTGFLHYFDDFTYTDPVTGIKTVQDGPGPILPRNKVELLQAMANILKLINSETRSFAAAAVPAVQANTEDKVILANFTPVAQAIWPGHIFAFVKP
ncbi:MAG: hypothetical protein M3O15_00865, partial [Acidobacteriota bacterium]|nr:hypothetical protein [Acidobacteriota bacterium]